MKKSTVMIALIVAFIGIVLVTGALFYLYSSNEVAKTKQETGELKVDRANRAIEEIQEDIVETKEHLVENETKLEEVKPNLEAQIASDNIPIVEVTETDLSESREVNEVRKKGERLTYIHQLKFNLVNTGKFSLKDVIFSIKDIYTENGVSRKKKAKDYSYMGRTFSTEDVGAYQNVEIPTLNLKSKKQVYVCNLPSSFGVGDYYFDIILEWNGGFYQMHVDIEELNGKLKYRYQFYDIDGKAIDFKKVEEKMKP
jgi:hypothetical protein